MIETWGDILRRIESLERDTRNLGIGQIQTVGSLYALDEIVGKKIAGVIIADRCAPGSSTRGLAEAITELGGSNGLVYLPPASYPINADYTAPTNAHLLFAKGASCAIANTKTLTINGTIEAGLYQIFSGAGSVDLKENPAYIEWFHDGGADHGPAFQKAMNASKNVTAPSKSYTIGTSIAIPRSYQRLFVYGDVTSTLAAGQAMFTYANRDRCVIKIFGKILGTGIEDFMRWTGGISNRIYAHEVNDFRYGFHLKQEAEGVTFTENIIEYNLIGACTKGVYVSSPPGGQATMPCEGLQLIGGFIWGCGLGVDIEANTNVAYLYATGAIDCTGLGGIDYRNLSTKGNALLVLKWITQSSSTFGPGDIVIDGRLGQIALRTNSTTQPAIKVIHQNPPAQPATNFRYESSFEGPGTVDTKEGILTGSDSLLGTAKAVTLNTYYDVKAGTAAGEKEGGIQLAYRRNDDTSAYLGGKVIIRKEAGSNLCSVRFFADNTTELGLFHNDGTLEIKKSLRLELTDATISGGVITKTSSYMRLDTEGGAAADDLDTILGGDIGDTLVLRTLSSARDVTLKDGTGNLGLAGDFILSNAMDTITLIRYDATWWIETSRSDNA